MTVSWLTADVFDGLATLEDGSVDLVITSPPFLALRSYLPADHPDKGKEIGSEATPAEFIDVLLSVTAELRRVLAPHGSIAIELGDTYASSGESGWHRTDPAKLTQLGTKSTMERPRLGGRDLSDGWPLAKSKTLIPQLYETALAYGINPLTGSESPAGRWRVRNVVTWCRPNPPVGALGDKWRPATSDVVVACVSGKRYWDDLATRREFARDYEGERRGGADAKFNGSGESAGYDPGVISRDIRMTHSGAPLLDYWVIPPTGYSGSHYAVFPPELVVPLVKAMCPSKVCRECGEPSRRIEDRTLVPVGSGNRGAKAVALGNTTTFQTTAVSIETLGFTDCGHDNYRPGRVLDPFAGSGTTLAVASGHGFDSIGFDLDSRNEVLARERIGPLLFGEVVG